ncbi:hypothetical protein SASPL_131183 [Salvia splendens]|uniref:Protein DA1-like domain-containing protein n=1 Tax=Salvia splendens TaxID=180675 RepID=A0A8X8ZLC6_SALSN|nr:hypothetical protein SASPL_131183 [Salvia splendens]
MDIAYSSCVESVLVAITKLAMEDTSLAWELSGIPNIPLNAVGFIEYRMHPFWKQKYCPSHEHDGTPCCYSCQRMEPVSAIYRVLDDGRKLCLECLNSSIMDIHECQPLYLEIQEFYEGLLMKGHYHTPETRGLFLSEEQTVSTIPRRPKIEGYRITDMSPEPYRLIRKCEVTQILFQKSKKGSTMWLDSEINAGSGSNAASASTSASSSGSSKKGKRSEFEKKLGQYFIQRIESGSSAVYGHCFREANKVVLKYGLRRTLDHIRLTGRFPC